MKKKHLEHYLVQLIEQPRYLTNPEFQFPQFKVLQSDFFLFSIEQIILALLGVF
jgi:hypothetical protein